MSPSAAALRGGADLARRSRSEPDQQTELHVRFEEVDDPTGTAAQTRVTVEHFGCDRIPAGHAARHGFPLATFQLRFAQWWRDLLGGLADTAVRR